MDRPLTVALVAGALALYVLRRILAVRRTSIADIPGPEPESWTLGNLRQIFQEQAGQYDFKWQEQYGGVVRIKGPFGEDRLMVSDPKTLQYIFQSSGYDIIKQPERKELSRLLTGRGLIWAEGDIHKRQRKVMNPAFGAAEVRAFVPVFCQCAERLASKWKEIIVNSGEDSQVFNIPSWVGRATMDAVGLASMDYAFDMVENGAHPLAAAYNNILQETHGRASVGRILFQNASYLLPLRLLEWVTDNGRARPMVRAREVTAMANEVAKELIESKRAALEEGKEAKDILSIVLRANASENEKTRLSDDEVYSQIRTVMLAGYETTANSLSWLLLELARHPDIQARLRAEVRRAHAEVKARGAAGFAQADLDAAPLLGAVVKEALRLHPVAHEIYRQTTKEDVFPLSRPIVTTSGRTVERLCVPKGLRIVASIAAYNRNKEVWGEDAHTFDPDRWIRDPAGGRHKDAAPVGVYANLMTFVGGVRTCIGWRFAVAEMQAFVAELVREFEFTLTDDARHIRRDVALVMIPTVEGQVDKGIQMPLRVSVAPAE